MFGMEMVMEVLTCWTARNGPLNKPGTGINVDFEDPVAKGSPQVEELNMLIAVNTFTILPRAEHCAELPSSVCCCRWVGVASGLR